MTKLEQLEQDVAFAKFDYEECKRAVAVKADAFQALNARYNTLAAVVDALESEEDAHIVLEAVRIRELERLNRAESKHTNPNLKGWLDGTVDLSTNQPKKCDPIRPVLSPMAIGPTLAEPPKEFGVFATRDTEPFGFTTPNVLDNRAK